MPAPLCDDRIIGKTGVRILSSMEFNGTLVCPEFSPIKQGQAQRDDRRINYEDLSFKPGSIHARLCQTRLQTFQQGKVQELERLVIPVVI